MRARSDTDVDNELLSVVLAKGGRKAVVGSGAGDVGLFSWGDFDDFSDSFPGARARGLAGARAFQLPTSRPLLRGQPCAVVRVA